MPPPPRKSSRIAQLAAIKASKAGGAEKRRSPTMDSTMDDTIQPPCRKKLQRPGGSPPPKQENEDADSASLIADDGNSVESALLTHTSPGASPSQEDDSPHPKQDNIDADSTFLFADDGDSMESVLPTYTSPDATSSQEDDSPQPKSNEVDDSATRELLQPIADSTSPAAFDKGSLGSSALTQTTSGASEIPDSIPSDALNKTIMDRQPRRTPMEEKEHYGARASLADEEFERWLGGGRTSGLFSQYVPYIRPFVEFQKIVDGGVQYFIAQCLPEDLSWEDLDTETQNRLKEWAPEAEQYVADLTTCGGLSQLLLAWVWRILFYNLFSADCDDKWAGEAWAGFGKMLQGLQGRITNVDNSLNWTFHTWRYHSVRMLHALHGAHTEPARLYAIFRQELDPLIKIKMSNDPEIPASRIDKCLKDMIERAIKLDLRVLSTKARICFEMRDPETLKVSGFTYKYDKNVMECYDEPEDGTVVSFVIRPSLRMYGRYRSWTDWLPRDPSQFHTLEPSFVDYHNFEAVPMVVAVKPAGSGMSDE